VQKQQEKVHNSLSLDPSIGERVTLKLWKMSVVTLQLTW